MHRDVRNGVDTANDIILLVCMTAVLLIAKGCMNIELFQARAVIETSVDGPNARTIDD